MNCYILNFNDLFTKDSKNIPLRAIGYELPGESLVRDPFAYLAGLPPEGNADLSNPLKEKLRHVHDL
jgi:hypothetical protein